MSQSSVAAGAPAGRWSDPSTGQAHGPGDRPARGPAATTQGTTLPEGARRLFPHYDAVDLDATPSLVIGRLLEDGDGEDLQWLFATFGEEAVRHWFAERGGRQLSARSRAFWRLVLGVEPRASVPGSEDLWPL